MAAGALMPWRETGFFLWPGDAGGAGFVLVAALAVGVAAGVRSARPSGALMLAAGAVAFYVMARNLAAADPFGTGVAVSQIGGVFAIGAGIDRLRARQRREPVNGRPPSL